MLATEYRTALPDEKTLAAELDRTRRMLDGHALAMQRISFRPFGAYVFCDSFSEGFTPCYILTAFQA